MSKLKVALSKFPNLPIKVRPLVGSRYTLLEARAMAAKFYREKLPKMTTIPKQIDSPPKLNVWLWIVGYLRVNWSDVEKNLTRSGRFLNLKRSLTLLSKLKHNKKVLYKKRSRPINRGIGIKTRQIQGASWQANFRKTFTSKTKKMGIIENNISQQETMMCQKRYIRLMFLSVCVCTLHHDNQVYR
ncbi:hypothetical protein RUM43_007835 [Polyplax serrata]|uniref:Uncharacterized protein n=1 Tax=Polyplax serrata TaxID=468196 RepID=A0AAN8PY21_POLSC